MQIISHIFAFFFIFDTPPTEIRKSLRTQINRLSARFSVSRAHDYMCEKLSFSHSLILSTLTLSLSHSLIPSLSQLFSPKNLHMSKKSSTFAGKLSN